MEICGGQGNGENMNNFWLCKFLIRNNARGRRMVTRIVIFGIEHKIVVGLKESYAFILVRSSLWLDLQMCGNMSCSNIIYTEDPFRFTARKNQDKSQTKCLAGSTVRTSVQVV